MEPWTVERVVALAPDSASEVAGRRLAIPAPWREVGWAEPLLWGACQGSGKTPYQVAIDTSGPRYQCSCPSRKFPCKHVLGLLFLWAEGRVHPGGGISEYAAAWAERSQAREAPDRREPKVQTPAQFQAASARAAQRDARVHAGMGELERWLRDQVTTGLAAAAAGGYRGAEAMSTRMVDAQAPGVAGRLLAASRIPFGGPGWPERLLEELGLLHLLASAEGRADLPDPLRATVRSRLGFSISREDVLASPALTDRWAVVGMRDSDDEQVATRRVWLHGLATGVAALVLLFAPPGQSFDGSLVPGIVVDADLHFYPGQPRLRALLGERRANTSAAGWTPPQVRVSEVRAAWRDALALDPWLTGLPVLVTGCLWRWSTGAAGSAGERWLITDTAGEHLPVTGSQDDLWQVLALTGGHPTTIFGEVGNAALRPTSLFLDGRLMPL